MQPLREPLEALIVSPLQFVHEPHFLDPGDIRIYDDTLRDGEQMPGVAFSPEQKLALATLLSDVGCHTADVCFPRSSEDEQKSLKLILDARRTGRFRDGFEIVVMCRASRREIDFTIDLIRTLGHSPHDVTFILLGALSDIHIKYKLGRTLFRCSRGREPDEREWLSEPVEFYRDANLQLMTDAIAYAREGGVQSLEFAGEDGSRADLDYVLRWAAAGKDAGGTRMCFSDTVGILTTAGVDHFIPPLVRVLDGVDLTAHFHNDYGQAAINTVRALSHGASHAGVTVNGIGERAGNASLHQVVMILRDQYGIVLPGFRYDRLRALSRRLEELSGIAMSAHEPVVGESVFTHESGIHAAGIAIHPAIYQTMSAEDLQTEIRFVFGKHTGRNAVRTVLQRVETELQAAGIELTDEFLDRVVDEVKLWRRKRLCTYQYVMHRHYSHIRHLALSEEQLVRLALRSAADLEPARTATDRLARIH